MHVDQVVTYLEMTAPAHLRPARPTALHARRVGASAAGLVEAVHRRVGTPHHWSSLTRTTGEWATDLRRPDLRTWVLEVDRDAAWLHTSSLDHPHALPNYLARGFRPFWRRTNRREIA